ncbi:MAG: hypothetical protein EOO28_00880 [Comamonadaceae bacterium]|nr:MAG: hypothetical protein EOO28_00880 [Comamonadaceae bacterium]
MKTQAEDNLHRDPITGEPGAHPVGTGLGAAGGAVAGAAFGAIGGPLGAAAGAVVGALAGGLAGSAAGEAVNPSAEEDYWRGAYVNEPYYDAAHPYTYDDYGPAYRAGIDARRNQEGDFAAVEPGLQARWDAVKGDSRLQWDHARHATRAAWDRLDGGTSEPLR